MADKKKFIDCGLIAKDEKIISRFKGMCEEFGYSFEVWPDDEKFMDEGVPCRMVAFYCSAEEHKNNVGAKASEIAQGVAFACESSFRFAIFDKLLSKEDTIDLKKAKVHYIMTKQDVEETSKLEFFTSQMVRAEYVAIKEMDLMVDVEVGFDVYHLMPLSQKFLKIIRNGNSFDERKQARMKEYGEFYVHRSELAEFTKYAREFGNTEEGMMRVCRAQFMEFQSKFGELAMMLTDESETMSFDEGKALLQNCNDLACQLAETLSKVGVSGMFQVINNSSVGEFGSIERAPAVAAYAAFFAMGLGKDNVSDIIFAALIMDLGLLYLDEKASKKIRDGKMEELNEEELEQYKRFPIKSVDVVLQKRIPLEENLKNMVLRARERADGKGFPKGMPADKLTEESQLLGFSSYFDKETLLTMGKKRVKPDEALSEVIKSQLNNIEFFNAMFIVAIKNVFEKQGQEKKAA